MGCVQGIPSNPPTSSTFGTGDPTPGPTVPIADPSADASPTAGAAGWAATGDLTAGRSFHSAIPLPEGPVLVLGVEARYEYPGGTPPTRKRSSVDMYDPTRGIWVEAGEHLGHDVGHTATLLPNSEVLLVGGLSGPSVAEMYTFATGVSMEIAPPTIGRAWHTATLLPDGRVLVAGGLERRPDGGEEPLFSAELFDPASGTWSITGEMATARGRHTATLLNDGRVLVVGGQNYVVDAEGLQISETIASAELYDPSTEGWTSAGSVSIGRGSHGATLLQDGRVLIAAGFGVAAGMQSEIYDPNVGLWSTAAGLAFERWGHTATLLPNGKVLVVGGPISGPESDPVAEIFDPMLGSWRTLGFPRPGRVWHTATLLSDGTVLIAGGTEYSSQAGLSSCLLFLTSAVQ